MEGELLDRVHELHGQALLAARDAEPGEERHELIVQAAAFEMVLTVFEDDWRPFDDGPLRAEYRAVSEAVLSADRTTHDLADREPVHGME